MSVSAIFGLFTIIFAISVQPSESASYCYYRYAYSRYYCYYYYDMSEDDSSLGGLIAGLVVLAIIVGVIIFIVKIKHNKTRVVAMSGNTGTTVHVSNVNTVHHPPSQPQYGYMQPQPQPGYMNAPNQPMYAGGNPAYPPGHHY